MPEIENTSPRAGDGRALNASALAEKLAAELFSLGGEGYGQPCGRIQFMLGTYDVNERPGGGLNRNACKRFAERVIAAAAPAAAPAWQPIETAPKDGSYFLAANEGGVWVAHYQPQAPSGYVFDNPWRSVMLNHWHIPEKRRFNFATHWMPLPAAPGVQTPAMPAQAAPGVDFRLVDLQAPATVAQAEGSQP